MKFSEVKEFSRPYVIAELGANHNGDMNLARKMIEAAKECGADCCKFQSWTKDTLISNEQYKKNPALEEEVDKYHISREQHIELKRYCDKIGIDFASTPFSKDEVNLLVDELDVPFIKVASMDLNNIPFLSYIAQKNKPVVMSTGLCGLDAVSEAVDCLKDNGCKQIYLLHCVSIYPPKPEQVNLNNIDMLRMAFNLPVGYSDHTIGTTAPIMSLAKGVCIIEKHFTLDKNMEGWDHKVSANPEEMKQICDAAHEGYKMLGSYTKIVSEDENQRNAFQRSIVASRHISKGQIITEDDLDYKRPGTGIPPKYYKFLIGKKATRDLEYDELFKMTDF